MVLGKKSTKIVALTNDVISSIHLKPVLNNGTQAGKQAHAFRVDRVEILVQSHAGIADGDYVIADFCHKDLNGKALADLVETTDDDYIERKAKIYALLGTNGSLVEIDDLAKKPLVIKFDNCFLHKTSEYFNLLIHGLGATRDTEVNIYGQYVNFKNGEKTKAEYIGGVDL